MAKNPILGSPYAAESLYEDQCAAKAAHTLPHGDRPPKSDAIRARPVQRRQPFLLGDWRFPWTNSHAICGHLKSRSLSGLANFQAVPEDPISALCRLEAVSERSSVALA